MGLDALKEALPDYAKDTKLNLGSILGTSRLTPAQVWGTAVATAMTAGQSTVILHIVEEASTHLSPDEVRGAKIAASIMAMTNVYYRGRHLLGDGPYETMRAGLRMSAMAQPGAAKEDFELWALAASTIGNCQSCVASHENILVEGGTSRDTIHEALKIAAIINAASVTLNAEQALAGSPQPATA